jgi:hypothetical protein
MTDQEIRAKALEIAAITLGAFPNDNSEDEVDFIPEVYLKRAKHIEAYIRGETTA